MQKTQILQIVRARDQHGKAEILALVSLFFKGTVSRDLLLHVFFHEYSPKPLKITLGVISNFCQKLADKLIKFATNVVDTGSKFTVSVFDKVPNLPPGSLIPVASHLILIIFTAGINDTGSKFATGVNDTGGK
jgi:hypothetical protein